MNQKVLKNTLFPLQDLKKDEVKIIANDLKLDLNQKKRVWVFVSLARENFQHL